MAAGLATIKSKFFKGDEKIPSLMGFPEMGGTPEKIDVTTFDDSVRRYILGVKDFGDLEFTFLYDGDQTDSGFKKLYAAQGTEDTYKLELPDGSSFSWTAEVSVRLAAGEVNGAITYIASFAMKSDVTYTQATV